jgi:hypothetical protein
MAWLVGCPSLLLLASVKFPELLFLYWSRKRTLTASLAMARKKRKENLYARRPAGPWPGPDLLCKYS